MNKTTNFIAADLGASNGRVVLGQWDGARFQLQELYRFPNGPVKVLGHLHWDALRIWCELQTGLGKYAAQYPEPLAGIAVDTWGVDYALLDRAGKLLGNPYQYRDSRTDGMLEQVFQKVSKKRIYAQTGNQFLQINTLFQLYSMFQAGDPQLEIADTFLMTPDLFHYWLSGLKANEYTIASTSQMLDSRERRWAIGLLEELGLPTHILQPIVKPGMILGDLRREVADEVGLPHNVSVIAAGSHDTASAVASISELGENSAYISMGTWSLMGVEIPEPIINETALQLNFTNEGGVGDTIRFLKIMTGLWLLQESRRTWAQEGASYTWNELLDLAEQAAPFHSLIDLDVPDFLSPGDMPAAIRAYCRRTAQPEPQDAGQVVRACLESQALKHRQGLEDLETLTGRRLEIIRIVGGGSQNRLLCAFTADACGREVVAGPVEATALGNLMLQAIAKGHLANIAEGRQAVAASVDLQRYEPHSSAAWEQAFARFKRLLH